MAKFIRVGVDVAKNYFQIHALESEDGRAVTRKLRRAKFLEFFAGLSPYLVAIEACGSAHHWARELAGLGHEVRLIPPIYVKPYVKRGKNDAVDAAAICEAASRPGMRFVPVKSAQQQAALMLHKTRELLIKQRTMNINALRGHLAEFGLVAAKGAGRVEALSEMAEADAALPAPAKACARLYASQIAALDESIDAIEGELAAIHEQDEISRLLDTIPGVGLIIATAVRALVADGHAFEAGRDFGAWLGLTPRQNSSGGKEKLGSITKQGNRYLRKLLVVGATSLLRVVGKRKGALRDWIVALLARKPARLATVALANKLARTIWAVMTTGEPFRTDMFAKA
jgi:transposase